ncbi:hypothetical protein CDAR_287311 [Caerostris darwini]|uniref:C2H2-type domain-containing protein n=1 Tax=Caerostris darwini TaxID=1538125 RepID=A0AAV4SF47_9ARAC|nr:hypothetical protein CDAR_287311 [Caerostris darwini]
MDGNLSFFIFRQLPTLENPYLCPECKTPFGSKRAMTQHRRHRHIQALNSERLTAINTPRALARNRVWAPSEVTRFAEAVQGSEHMRKELMSALKAEFPEKTESTARKRRFAEVQRLWDLAPGKHAEIVLDGDGGRTSTDAKVAYRYFKSLFETPNASCGDLGYVGAKTTVNHPSLSLTKRSLRLSRDAVLKVQRSRTAYAL